VFPPAQPRRAETRLVPSKAAGFVLVLGRLGETDLRASNGHRPLFETPINIVCALREQRITPTVHPLFQHPSTVKTILPKNLRLMSCS
jgi:hypothetical protein